MKSINLLQLGGSLEAFNIAEALSHLAHIRLITSFAGRTQRRRAIKGEERVGHFGGIQGLIAYAQAEPIDAFIDATHPFAVGMKHNASQAAQALNKPIVFWHRPLWQAETDDRWIETNDAQHAAQACPKVGDSVLLAIGRQEIEPFAARVDLSLTIRLIDEPSTPFDHPNTRFVKARGPFDLNKERDFFHEHNIQAVISKNSGGEAAKAKLTVARELGLPVVMIKRPSAPQGLRVETIPEIINWTTRLLSS